MPPYLNEEGCYDDYNNNDIGLVGRDVDGGRDACWVGVPLVGVDCEAHVVDFIAECKLTQCYVNSGANSIQAKYVFPMDESAAVCGFEAEYEDGRIVKGVVKEKEQARSEFQKAVRCGKQANLLETVRRDVFALEVGNLPAGAYLKITITYVTSLKARDDAAAFILPTYIAPRYTPPNERLSPEEAQAMAGGASFVKLFGISIKVNFSCLSNIKEIACPTHKDAPSLSTWFDGKTGHLMLQAPMDRDLVALVKEEHCHQPRAVVERSPSGSMAGFVTLYPKLEFPDLKRDFTFLIDRSGSMIDRSGMEVSKIKQASDTLLLFLRALPMSCTFNIVGFGSKFSSLFPRPMSYSDETLQIASRYAERMAADFGGTEIFAPLEHIFCEPFPPNVERQVFVLTDGQVSNDKQVFDVIRRHCSNDAKCRLFSVGLGSSASRHLVEGMARAGRGTSRFVEDGAHVELREKVLGQLKQALQPSLHNVNIKWNFPSPTASSCSPTAPPVKTLLGYRSPAVAHATKVVPKIFPAIVPPVFSKERFLSYALFPEGSEIPHSVTISCATSEGLLETTLEIGEDEMFQGTIAHRMAAKVGISEYEDHRKTPSVCDYGWFQCAQTAKGKLLNQGEALQLALANGLASEQTSFIAVLDDLTKGSQNSHCYPTTTGEAHAYPAPQHGPPMAPTSCQSTRYARKGGSSLAIYKKYADGFHSSSSDVGLQQKYGHTQLHGNVASAAGQPVNNLNRGPDFSHGISLQRDDEAEETTRRVGFNPSFAPSNISFQPPPMMSHVSYPSGSAMASFAKAENQSKGADWTFGLKNKMTKWLNPEATCVDLGDSMQAYYDGGKKIWVFPGEESQKTGPPPLPPPPTTIIMQHQAATAQVNPYSVMMSPRHRKPPGALCGMAPPSAQGMAPSLLPPPAGHTMPPPPRQLGMTSPGGGMAPLPRAGLAAPPPPPPCMPPPLRAMAPLPPAALAAPPPAPGQPVTPAPPPTPGQPVTPTPPPPIPSYGVPPRPGPPPMQHLAQQHACAFTGRNVMPTKSPSSSDPLLNLCVLQRANGSFVWDKSLEQALSWSNLDMKEVLLATVTATSLGGEMAPATKGTVLAVAAMRVFFADQKLVWELQEEKALEFLSSQGLSRLEIESLLNATESKLKA